MVCGTPCRGTVALFRKLLLTLSVVTSEAYQCITFAARARLPSTIMRVQDTQFEDNALAIAFGSPILCVRLGDALPQGTLEALAEDVLSSWGDYIDAREQLGDKDLNADFFFYQSTVYGDTDHCRSTPPANPRAWMAGVAGQEVIKAVTAAASSYIERVGFHATGDAEATKLTPNNMHMWASVHQDGSAHPQHVHVGAVLSGVLYVRSPEGSGEIVFHDPRGSLPPFGRAVSHKPCAGDLLIFPPWLEHGVAATATVDGPRISVSFNYGDFEHAILASNAGGRALDWGDPTAAIEVMTIERDLGMVRGGGGTGLLGAMARFFRWIG